MLGPTLASAGHKKPLPPLHLSPCCFPKAPKLGPPGMPHLHISPGATSHEGLKVLSLVPVCWSLQMMTLEAGVSLWLQSNRIFLKVITCWASLAGPPEPVESLAQSISVSSRTVGLRLGWGERTS